MPKNPSEAPLPPSENSPDSLSPSPDVGATPAPEESLDPRAEYPAPPSRDESLEEAPPSLLQGESSQFRGLPNPAHPALLLLANPDGSLKPPHQEWQEELLLEEGSLVPQWFPWVWEDEELSPDRRKEQFRLNLDVLLKLLRPATSKSSDPSATASPTRTNWTPPDVLQSLLQLRSAVLPE